MHIVDRRLNPAGKSFANRQRFLRRAREMVRQAVRDSTRERAIEDFDKPAEVTIPVDGLREPNFRHAHGGKRDLVLPGNKDYVEGDRIARPPSGDGNGGQGPGQGGDGAEDAFSFVLTREEFLNIFLDDLELPDLEKHRLAEVETEGLRRAGYTTAGSPANLSLSRTMRTSLARRIALGRPKLDEVAALAEALTAAEAAGDAAETARLRQEIADAERRRLRIAYLDPIDLRYRRFEPQPRPVTQAVMFCLMDVSGSMTEHMKDLAKRFFMLLHVFLTRRYKRVDVVFIRHTDKAKEVDERTFFRSSETGGTLVSSALTEMAKIIQERYDPKAWNIYGAQASDGDNGSDDSERTSEILRKDLLPACQYFAYVEVSEGSGFSNAFIRPQGQTALWRTYAAVRQDGRFQMRKVARREDIYPVFRQLFQKREGAMQGTTA